MVQCIYTVATGRPPGFAGTDRMIRHREDEMAHTAYAGDTTTDTAAFGKRVSEGAKRVFAALIRAREREAMNRIQIYLGAIGHPYTLEHGRIKDAR